MAHNEQHPHDHDDDDVKLSKGRQRCGTMEKHSLRAARDPEYVRRRRRAEAEAQQWLARTDRGTGGRGAVIRIPVVVHVVYRTAAENISDAQINSQITALNSDFRLLGGTGAIPTVFASLAADTRIEFALARRDPACNPTTGITRTLTTVSSWADFSDAMKSTATGGIDPWDTTRYLNIWVISNSGGTFIGWAEFPGAPAAEDGVVIRHGSFGTTGTATAPFDGGQTATHEVGHWLDLLHIWGDGGCGIDDGIADTPTQGASNGGCPTHPSPSCGNGGDMFMNYMDYVDDDCMHLFTVDQSDRMHATLATSRTGILASNGLVPPPTGGSTTDLWIADTADDEGVEPNPSLDPMWLSPDIWVRNQDDGVANQAHENPEYRTPGGASSFVYVRVRNRACGGSGSATLKLYWAKASSGLSWPAPWDGSVTIPAQMGGFIGQSPVTVAGGATQIVRLAWNPPNPADYASFGADQGHFCLLARLETSSLAPFGMTTPETSDLNANVRNNNNIAWKNVTVVDDEPGGGRFGSMLVAAPGKQPVEATLELRSPDPKGRNLFDWGDVIVHLSPALYRQWLAKGGRGDGIEACLGEGLRLTRRRARIEGLELDPKDPQSIQLQFVARRPRPRASVMYRLDVIQWVGEHVVGGVSFDVPVIAKRPRPEGCGTTHVWDGVTWVPRHRLQGCGCKG